MFFAFENEPKHTATQTHTHKSKNFIIDIEIVRKSERKRKLYTHTNTRKNLLLFLRMKFISKTKQRMFYRNYLFKKKKMVKRNVRSRFSINYYIFSYIRMHPENSFVCSFKNDKEDHRQQKKYVSTDRKLLLSLRQ